MTSLASEPLESKLKALPAQPGCYIFRDRKGGALYVGKAKNLRSRVRSYFQDGGNDTRAFIPILLRVLANFETIVTKSEKEAAILENSLIKESKPRFNVKLRDDKEYLSLRLDTLHEWPRLELVRRPAPDKARYFGPYHSATSARRTLHLVEKHFQLRTCTDRELSSRKRPCLMYQIKRCPAPCVYNVDRERYAQQVHAVGLFLDGRHDELSAELETRMDQASAELEYELAAVYRDQLRAVHSVREQQRVVAVSEADQDVLGLYREGDRVELSTMNVRAGRVVEVLSFSHRKVELPDDEIVAAFLREYYADGGASPAQIPDEILLPALPEGADGVAEWLSERRKASPGSNKRTGLCRLLCPQRGYKKQLLDMALENARHFFEEKQRAEEDIDVRLAQLQKKLRLKTLPRRIECCDISHLGGQDTVGAVVAFFNGLPDKERYRTYHVKHAKPGDDYAAMFEVLGRRFRRAIGAQQGDGEADQAGSLWELPDLFVVDGGRGQLSVALTAAHDLGLHELSIVALAKEREHPQKEKLVDRVYLPGQKNPLGLKPNSFELFILARARDEAHRFSNRGRKKVGKRRRFSSSLDDVSGVGPKTKKRLLSELGSVKAVKAASDEVLLGLGISRRQLRSLRQALGQGRESQSS